MSAVLPPSIRERMSASLMPKSNLTAVVGLAALNSVQYFGSSYPLHSRTVSALGSLTDGATLAAPVPEAAALPDGLPVLWQAASSTTPQAKAMNHAGGRERRAGTAATPLNGLAGCYARPEDRVNEIR